MERRSQRIVRGEGECVHGLGWGVGEGREGLSLGRGEGVGFVVEGGGIVEGLLRVETMVG